jgi:hypothetical protein
LRPFCSNSLRAEAATTECDSVDGADARSIYGLSLSSPKQIVWAILGKHVEP